MDKLFALTDTQFKILVDRFNVPRGRGNGNGRPNGDNRRPNLNGAGAGARPNGANAQPNDTRPPLNLNTRGRPTLRGSPQTQPLGVRVPGSQTTVFCQNVDCPAAVAQTASWYLGSNPPKGCKFCGKPADLNDSKSYKPLTVQPPAGFTQANYGRAAARRPKSHSPGTGAVTKTATPTAPTKQQLSAWGMPDNEQDTFLAKAELKLKEQQATTNAPTSTNAAVNHKLSQASNELTKRNRLCQEAKERLADAKGELKARAISYHAQVEICKAAAINFATSKREWRQASKARAAAEAEAQHALAAESAEAEEAPLKTAQAVSEYDAKILEIQTMLEKLQTERALALSTAEAATKAQQQQAPAAKASAPTPVPAAQPPTPAQAPTHVDNTNSMDTTNNKRLAPDNEVTNTSEGNKRLAADAEALHSSGASSTLPSDSNPTPAEARVKAANRFKPKKKGEWADKVDSSNEASVDEDDLNVDETIPKVSTGDGDDDDDDVPEAIMSPAPSPRQSHRSSSASSAASSAGRRPQFGDHDRARIRSPRRQPATT